MANKPVSRKTTNSNAPKAPKASKAQASASAHDDDAVDAAAAAAEKEAEDAKKQAALLDLKGRLSDTLHSLKEGDKKSAEQARLDWVEIGRALNEGRALFTKTGEKGNQTDEKGFGRWLVEQGFNLLGQRPTRAGAAWLANVYDFKPALYALFPTESVDGEPLRRSPRTLQAWVRENIYSAFQDAWEIDTDNVEIAADADGDKSQKTAIAKSAMPNVYDALSTQMTDAEQAVSAAEAKLKEAKTQPDRASATKDYMSVCSQRDRLALRKAIMDQHNESEMLSFFIGWRPKVEAVAFRDTAPREAAERLFALLKQHPEAGEVYDVLGELVDELLAKVAADDGDVSGDDTDADTGTGADTDTAVDAAYDDDDFEIEDDDDFEIEDDDESADA